MLAWCLHHVCIGFWLVGKNFKNPHTSTHMGVAMTKVTGQVDIAVNRTRNFFPKGICLHLKCPRCWIRTNHEVWPPWGMPCRAARTRTTPAAQMTRGPPEQQGVLAPLKSSARCVWPADIIGIRALSVPSQTSAKKRSTDRRQAA